VDCVNVVVDLRRVIGAEGRALLKSFDLIDPLLRKMITEAVLSQVDVSNEELEQARLELLEQRGYERLDQWSEFLEDIERPNEEVVHRMTEGIRRRTFIEDQFAAKAEARFLDRKHELDQVVYSLLRLENSYLARELYLQIESGESNFADLAKKYAEGPERNTNGIVGPVSLTQAHPELVEKLRVSQPGVLLEPFKISDWWLVVRLERYSPATFSDEISNQMCLEMFDAWVGEQVVSCLEQLQTSSNDRDKSSDSKPMPSFSDFSIS
jgi:parvulin-like peptidyl-prolyl isomerase